MRKIFSLLIIILSLFVFACNEEHTHEFVNGFCECGEKHDCTFVDGKCECGKEENHEHVFENGECACGEKHNCTFVDGKCECGKLEEIKTIEVESVEITGNIKMLENEEQTLTLNVLPEDATNKEVTWISSDATVATVDNGLVKALKAGTVTIKAISNNGKEASLEITIESNNITDFKIKVNTSICLNEKFEIKIEYDKSKETLFEIQVDSEILNKLDDNSKYEAIKAGKTTIVVKETLTGITKSIDVEVINVSEAIITEYLETKYMYMEVSEDIEFEKYYLNTNIELTFYTSEEKYLSSEGKFNAPILDTEIELTVIFFIGSEEYAAFIPIICKGWGSIHDVVENYIDDFVPEETKRNIQFPVKYYDNKATIKWYIGEDEIENGYFSFERTTGKNYDVVIKAVIDVDGVKKTKEYTVRCMMQDTQEKVDLIFEEYNAYYDELDITESIELPTYDRDYGATIYWRSYNAGVLDVDGTFTKPFNDIEVKMMVIITAGEYQKLGFITFKTIGERYNSKLDKIEYVLDQIHSEEIQTHKYYLFGSESGYERVLTKNIGYIPFVMNEEVKVTQDILENGTAAKPDRKRKSTDYITLHNTGMAHESATAKGLNDFIHEYKYTRQASWHYSIDDYEAYQHVNLDEVAWHAGDGGYTTGDVYFNETYQSWSIGGGNNNSIGIEICVYKGIDFNQTMRNVAKLVSKLLVDYNLTPSDIRQHWDFAGKNCPQVLRESGRWPEMLQLIAIDYFIRTELSDVTFEFESLTPEYLDNNGKIIKNDNTRPEVSYKVKVTFDGQTKEYTYKSVLLPL